MRYLPLGVGDAFSAKHYTCCVAVEAEGTWILVDCPHPIRKMMREGSEAAGVQFDVGDIAAVCVTHLHADHSSGLEGFGFFNYFVHKRRAPLVCHPDVAVKLWHGLLAGGMEDFGLKEIGEEPEKKTLEDYFEVTSLTEAEPVEVGPFTIECMKTKHPIPTTAYRISAGGKSLGHSSDTYFDRELIDWLGEADVMIHETNFGIHTPYEMLAELPEDVRAKMRLIHYPDGFDHDASNIQTLHQGVIYDV